MNTNSVLGYDHARKEFSKKLREANIEIVDTLKDLRFATVALVHPSGDIKKTEWNELLKECDTDSIIIRTSSQGRHQKTHRITTNGVIVLQLQISYYEINGLQLKEIIEEIRKPGIAKAIVKGEISPRLAKYFSIIKNTNVIYALTILCQGYLAIRSDCQVQKKDGPIHDALEKMQWSRFLNSDISKEFLNPDIFNENEILRNSTDLDNQNTDYWKPVREWMNEKDAATEWSFLDGNRIVGAWKTCKTRYLIKVINGIKTDIEHTPLVAEVFLELQQLLNGENNV